MIRQIVIPTGNTLLLHIPDNLIGKKLEVIAFSQEDIAADKQSIVPPQKKSIEDALAFFKKNSVDFSGIKKWRRDDLYD